jgi:hypothetical protein
MRRRLTILWTPLVLLIALAVPATVAAGSGYQYQTVWNYCSAGQANLKMRNIAQGSTPANKLTIDAWAQRRVSGTWRTVHTWSRSVTTFSANGQKHTLTVARSYSRTSAQYVRIVFRLRAWQGNSVLADGSFKSIKC